MVSILVSKRNLESKCWIFSVFVRILTGFWLKVKDFGGLHIDVLISDSWSVQRSLSEGVSTSTEVDKRFKIGGSRWSTCDVYPNDNSTLDDVLLVQFESSSLVFINKNVYTSRLTPNCYFDSNRPTETTRTGLSKSTDPKTTSDRLYSTWVVPVNPGQRVQRVGERPRSPSLPVQHRLRVLSSVQYVPKSSETSVTWTTVNKPFPFGVPVWVSVSHPFTRSRKILLLNDLVYHFVHLCLSRLLNPVTTLDDLS